MTTTTRDTRGYTAAFDAFARSIGGHEPGWLTDLRKSAIERVRTLGMPDTRHEDWRWTSLKPLDDLRIGHAGAGAVAALDASALDGFGFEGLDAARLVLVNGMYAPGLSTGVPEGVEVDALVSAADRSEAVRATLARIAPHQDRAFLALNTAFMGGGVFVRIRRGASIDRPLHVLSVTTEEVIAHPRVLVIAEPESRVTLLDTHDALGCDGYASIPVTEILCSTRADVRHVRVQRHAGRAVHVGALAVRQEAESRFTSTAVDLGARLARNELHVRLDGEHTYMDVGALYVGRDAQVIDNHSRLDHAMPHGESHQLFKGILDDKSRGIFDGKIYVHRDAQKTDAKQTGRNLLLSDDAISNNKPQLEIYADDVKCTHGATTGQLDPDQLFYLQARGLDLDTARSLLTYAFGREVVDRIELEPVRRHVDREVLARLPMGELVGAAL